jgi:hypothetical protein
MTHPSSLIAVVLIAAAFGCGSEPTVVPFETTVVAKVSGDAQQVLVGQAEPAPLVVSITAVNGDPIAGTQVNWGIVSGGGTLSASSSTTDQSGNASVTWTLGQSGDQIVKAWTNVAGAPSVTFSAALITQLVTIVSGDAQKGPFSVALPAPLVVSVTTPSGTPVPNAKVNWGVVAGGGALSAMSSTTDQTGKASTTLTVGAYPNVNQSVKAWTDTEGSQSVAFSATGQATLVLHYDGTNWSRSLNTSQYGISVNTGWAPSPSIAFAAGTQCPDPGVLSYANGVWSGMDKCAGTTLQITSIWGTAPNDGWAVGAGQGGTRIAPAPRAWVYHFDGSNWTVSYTDSAMELIAIGERSTDDVIAVGLHGRIVRHAGSQWLEQTSGTANDLLAVWGDPNSSRVFAVGAAGTLVSYDGVAWGTQISGTVAPVRGVWGSSATDVFAVGDNGTILHFDGTSWTAQSSGTTQNLRGVWGSSPNSVFAVGAGSTILHYDGVSWTAQSPGVQMAFTSVWGTSASNVFVAGR